MDYSNPRGTIIPTTHSVISTTNPCEILFFLKSLHSLSFHSNFLMHHSTPSPSHLSYAMPPTHQPPLPCTHPPHPTPCCCFYLETLASAMEEGSPSSNLGTEEATWRGMTTTMAPIATTTTVNNCMKMMMIMLPTTTRTKISTYVCNDDDHATHARNIVCRDLCHVSHPCQLSNMLICVIVVEYGSCNVESVSSSCLGC